MILRRLLKKNCLNCNFRCDTLYTQESPGDPGSSLLFVKGTIGLIRVF